ncbi:putative type II/IV secretion system protein [Rhodobacteraceae bacterium KLH11]|nr:putative type II/IV secretion system protein [Rhodobacteraceae bacterium KLH11]
MSFLQDILSRFRQSAPDRRVLPNGIIDVLDEDEDFAAIAAVREDGTCFVAAGYQHQDVFLEGLQRLQETGRIPQIGTREPVELEEIRNLYRPELSTGLDAGLDQSAQTRGQQRLRDAIVAAAEARASDIKIHLRETKTEVRFRVAGNEFNYGQPWTHNEGIAAISYAFDAQDKGAGAPTMQDAGMQGFSISPQEKLPLPSNVIKLRCAMGPHEGETKLVPHLVIRLFYSNDHDTGRLNDLGFDAEILSKLGQARADLRGGIIFGGATGDGKSTTLIKNGAQLYDQHGGRKSVVTVEDPVEYRLTRSGVIQIPLQSAGNEDDQAHHYGNAMRHFMRINPDVGIISEIRNGIAGTKLLQFILSGHQLYSTLHVESANGIPFRLISMGVPAEELSHPGLIRLLIKQTLLPLLCDHCKHPMKNADLSEDDRMLLAPLKGNRDELFLRNPEGCAACQRESNEIGRLAWWGYRREIAVGEVIEPDTGYLKCVRDKDAIGALEHWLKPRVDGGLGGITISQKMTELALSGRVDPRDVVLKRGDLTQRMNAVQKAFLKWGEG